jgi:ComF family protein
MKGNKRPYEFFTGFRELFFPESSRCPACQQEPAFRRGLGHSCLSRIILLEPPFCLKCGRPLLLESLSVADCQQCRTVGYHFRIARSVGLYEGALREYLTDLKYRYRPELGAALGELLVEWVRIHPDFRKHDLIVPIPIHLEKRAVRGYNQAELLARPLGYYLGLPVRESVLLRVKATHSQSALHKEERFVNLRDAFQISDTPDLIGKKVLLIDDIITTGATVSEAARKLLQAGALVVRVLTLATGVMDDDGAN